MDIIKRLENTNISEDCFNNLVHLIENYIDEVFDWRRKYHKKENTSPNAQARKEQFIKLGKMLRDSKPGLNDEETKQTTENALKDKKNFQQLLNTAQDTAQENILKGNIKRTGNIINRKNNQAINKNSQLQADYENMAAETIKQFRALGKKRNKK